MNDALELAKRLYRLGFSIIPLTADKRPARPWKRYQSERCTPTDLDHWFGLADYRPGIVTGELSGIVVVDCDDEETVAAFRGSYAASPIEQRTRRGSHFVYRHPGWRTPNRQRVDGLPCDVRGDGGYVVAYADAITWAAQELETAPSYVEPCVECLI